MERKDFEIMAPAGSRESLIAAIQGGADAAYFGIEGLNMRAHSSKSFTLEDLPEVAALLRDHGMKSYLTVNTIIYPEDMVRMHEIIDTAKAAGISAIIATDIATMAYAYEQGVEVHLSTQLNISNVEALRFYARYADVVVLARELTLDQVELIHRAIEEEHICGPKGKPIRIEMFAHGALCMAVSGKCYLSLGEMNKSANRGECNQICRRRYLVTDDATGDQLTVDGKYIMSPKDLKTIHFLNKMIDAGVRVFKIEGRARGPEYVRTVSECYDEAIRAYLDGSYGAEKIAGWDERLATVFNRGFWDGYYLGQRLGEWTDHYGSDTTEVKVGIGRVSHYYTKIGVAELVLETGYVEEGERLLVTGPTTGAVFFEAKQMLLGDKSERRSRIDEIGIPFSIKVPEELRPGDRLFVMRKRKKERGSKYF